VRRITTLHDLAHNLDLSASTVSRALNGYPHVAEETRRRVISEARRLGYQPNVLARALRQERTMLVGLVVPDIRSAFFAGAATVLQSVLEENGYRVILCISHEDADVEREYLLSLLGMRVDGIIHVPCAPESGTLIRETADKLPLVELYRHSGGRAFDAVTADDRDGASQLTKHLLGLGHTRIAMVVGSKRLSTTEERVAGFHEAAAAAGLGDAAVEYGEFSHQWGYESVINLMTATTPPTAIIAASNQLVSGALRAGTDLGLRIPQDVSLVAFDDPEWYSLCRPSITTYAPPLDQMGLLAAQLLVRQMSMVRSSAPHHPIVARLSGMLVVRESSAPIQSSVGSRAIKGAALAAT
jgi:LacI family transcriptional regulator